MYGTDSYNSNEVGGERARTGGEEKHRNDKEVNCCYGRENMSHCSRRAALR